MAASGQYRPTPLGPGQRRAAILQQALALPRTLSAIRRIVREDFDVCALDADLSAFWGFFQDPQNPQYRARPWQQVRLRDIEPHDVVAVSVPEMALMLFIAMEDESPILEYSHQSGEGFRYLLPTLGRFMGTNLQQAAYAKAHGLPWCEAAWCAEERRHSNALARMIERLVKAAPSRDNPNDPMVVTASEADALLHLVSRQASEWNASSSYVLMAAHARGELHRFLRNLARDEVKHFAILSAAHVYLFGPRPWARFVDVLKKGLANYRNQQRSRTGGEQLGANPVTAIEGIWAHLLTERYLRKWLRTVPLLTLTRIFEVPSRLPELPSFVSPEQQARADETVNQGAQRRLALGRWTPRMRRNALAQQEFEQRERARVDAIIARDVGGFSGARRPGSQQASALRRRIRWYRPRALRRALRDRLRDYQINQSEQA